MTRAAGPGLLRLARLAELAAISERHALAAQETHLQRLEEELSALHRAGQGQPPPSSAAGERSRALWHEGRREAARKLDAARLAAAARRESARQRCAEATARAAVLAQLARGRRRLP